MYKNSTTLLARLDKRLCHSKIANVSTLPFNVVVYLDILHFIILAYVRYEIILHCSLKFANLGLNRITGAYK